MLQIRHNSGYVDGDQPMRKFLLALPVIFGSFGAAHADEPTALWQTVTNWQIRVDPSLGHGCFIFGTYQRGEVLRVGLDNRRQMSGYMILGSEKWKSLEVGKKYTVSVTFAGAAPFEWTGTAIAINPSMGSLWFSFANADIWKLLAERTAVSISYQGNFVTALPLSNTREAVKTMFECNSQFYASADPFATPARTDPFAAH